MWTYQQSTGQLRDADGNLVATGYAGGNEGKNPEGVNNPDMETVHAVGPLPVGLYEVGNPVEGSHLGPFALPLSPDSNNTMYGRGGFFCHGDNSNGDQSASEGCIIMPRYIREQIYTSADKRIGVIV